MITVDYPDLLNLISEYNISGRTESAAFLMWYLENYYRLDSQEAVDHVCDQNNDKGIDGIYINEANGTIDVFQCKISQTPGRTIGDKFLREFYGSLSQFSSKEQLKNLVNTAGNNQVANLVNRLQLIDNLGAYNVRGIFLANIELDGNGRGFLQGVNDLDFFGKTDLENTYISSEKQVPANIEAKFDVSDVEIAKYYSDPNTLAVIAPVKAIELTRMQGIADQSVFAYNVRGPLGNTKVNRDIVETIKDQSYHKKFPLFHNGITIVTNELDPSDDNSEIKIKTFFVVNGCQSLTALYGNRNHLTDNLRILAKFIKVDVSSDLSKTITKFSNNQNGVKARDFKSNNNIQIRLQNEFRQKYGNDFYYEIQRGEDSNGLPSISNEQTGIRLMAFDLKEPWNTRRRYQVFDDKYNEIFARPEVDAHRIVLVDIIENRVKEKVGGINNELVAKYDMTRYTIMYIIRKILEQDEWGKEVISNPKKFVNDNGLRDRFGLVIDRLVEDIIIDLNGEIDEQGEDFDYKSRYRDKDWIDNLSREIVANYQKLLSRGRVDSLEVEWNNTEASSEQGT